MKLLVITSSWPRFDGDYAGHFIREWVAQVGFPATVIVPAVGKSDSATKLENTAASTRAAPTNKRALPPISVVEVPYGHDPRLFHGGGILANLRRNPLVLRQIPRALFALLEAAIACARDADVIVTHWLLPAGLVGAIVARRFNRPHVAISHGSDRWLIGTVPILGRRILARSVAVPMGVPVMRAVAPRAVFSRIAYVGRLEREKGIDVLSRAMERLPWLDLTVAGNGSLRPPSRSAWLGAVSPSEVPGILARHDGCVIPSRREGAPRTLLEAMIVGRPIVAARVGRIPEIARDNREALLVPPNSPAALADALTRLRDDRALRERLGAAAHRRALAFTWPRVAAAYRRILAEATA